MAKRDAMLTRDGLLGENNPDADFWNRVWNYRHVGDYPCRECDGLGRRIYGSSAGWRRGAAGQTVTCDVCDKCWGSGDAMRHGANLRALEDKRP